MRKHIVVIALGVTIVTILLLYMMTFTVRWQEKLLVLTFDKISREVDEAGLHWKVPMFQKAVKFDTRIRTLQQQSTEIETRDKQTIIVSVYVNWRISEARPFFERCSEEGTDSASVIAYAEDLMQGWINDAANAFAEYDLSELITVDASRFQLASLETNPSSAAGGLLERIQLKASAEGGYGIEILDLGIRKLGIPDNVTTSVNMRMQSDRQKEVRRLLSEGKGEAASIEGDAKSKATILLAEAQAKAKDIKGRGDAEAAKHYKKFLENAKLANFLRRLETLRTTLSDRTTLILDSKSPPYQLLTTGADLMEEEEE